MIGIFICIGPIIDEVQEYGYVNNRGCAKARQLLLIIWLFVGFNLTLCYKEVLVANLINVEYEDPIDDFSDLVLSGRKIIVPQNSYVPSLLVSDQRMSVKELLGKPENMVYFNYTGTMPLRYREKLGKECNSHTI